VMLAESLKGVISQVLCKKIGGGRAPALEVLLVDHAIANLIREGKTTQMPSAMQVGKAKGNVMMNDALIDLVKAKKVEPQEAYNKSTDKGGFENFLKREKFDTAFISPEKPAAAPAAVGGVAVGAGKYATFSLRPAGRPSIPAARRAGSSGRVHSRRRTLPAWDCRALP
jgi:hypothetical protein